MLACVYVYVLVLHLWLCVRRSRENKSNQVMGMFVPQLSWMHQTYIQLWFKCETLTEQWLRKQSHVAALSSPVDGEHLHKHGWNELMSVTSAFLNREEWIIISCM